MHDLEIEHFWFKIGLLDSLEGKIQTPALKEVASNFLKNMNRAYDATILMPSFLGLAKMRVYAETVAIKEVTKEYLYFMQQVPDEQREEVESLRLRIGYEILKKQEEGKLPDYLSQGAELAHKFLRENAEFIKKGLLPEHEAKARHTGYKTLFDNAVVSSWTAFEVMSQELWEAALNTHPETLSLLNGDRKKRTKEDKIPEPGKIGLADIASHGFDLSNKMGTLLKETQDFSKLGTIRVAYFAAFKSDSAAIDSALLSPALDLLSAVRNSVVHHHGRVRDQWWNKKKKSFKDVPYFGQLKEGDEIELTGKRVSRMLTKLICVTARLIKRVDSWILRN